MDTMKKRELPDVWREKFTRFALDEADFPSARG
jgi:hypothetical protein